MKYQHPWIRKISYHVDSQPPWNSIGKQANTTTSTTATFPRQMYKLIVGRGQVFYDFIVFFTKVQPCFGDGYKIHVYLSHVIRINIGFATPALQAALQAALLSL